MEQKNKIFNIIRWVIIVGCLLFLSDRFTTHFISGKPTINPDSTKIETKTDTITNH